MRISLGSAPCVAQGKNRDIYLHPGDPGALIKVINPGRKRREAALGRLGRMLKPSYLREFMSEIDAVYRAQRRAPASMPRLPIIEAAGLVSTDLGLGLSVERIASEDMGRGLAPTLADLLRDGQFDAALLAHLNTFVARMFALHVVADDFDPKNIVWDAAHESFVMVDGFGVKPVVPIHVWSKTLNALQLSMAIERRLAGRTGLTWDRRARRLSF